MNILSDLSLKCACNHWYNLLQFYGQLCSRNVIDLYIWYWLLSQVPYYMLYNYSFLSFICHKYNIAIFIIKHCIKEYIFSNYILGYIFSSRLPFSTQLNWKRQKMLDTFLWFIYLFELRWCFFGVCTVFFYVSAIMVTVWLTKEYINFVLIWAKHRWLQVWCDWSL